MSSVALHVITRLVHDLVAAAKVAAVDMVVRAVAEEEAIDKNMPAHATTIVTGKRFTHIQLQFYICTLRVLSTTLATFLCIAATAP